MLDLGPLHHKVSTHMQTIITNPLILLCKNPSYDTASFDGDKWQNPDIFKLKILIFFILQSFWLHFSLVQMKHGHISHQNLHQVV